MSNTSLARGSAWTKSTPLAGEPVLSVESSAASTLHAGLRCLCSSAQSLLNLVLHWGWTVSALSVRSWFYPASGCNCTTKVMLVAKHWCIIFPDFIWWFYSSCLGKVATSLERVSKELLLPQDLCFYKGHFSKTSDLTCPRNTARGHTAVSVSSAESWSLIFFCPHSQIGSRRAATTSVGCLSAETGNKT